MCRKHGYLCWQAMVFQGSLFSAQQAKEFFDLIKHLLASLLIMSAQCIIILRNRHRFCSILVHIVQMVLHLCLYEIIQG